MSGFNRQVDREALKKQFKELKKKKQLPAHTTFAQFKQAHKLTSSLNKKMSQMKEFSEQVLDFDQDEVVEDEEKGSDSADADSQ